MEIIKNMFFSMVKSFKFIVKTNVFDKYAGCVRERKRYQTTPIMRSNSFPKSITNRCENDARKSDSTIMEEGANMESKR